MARRVPGPPAGRARIYIPAALDNRQDPEPIEVEILQPTEAQRRDIFRSDTWQTAALNGYVRSVRRYEDSTGAPISDGPALWTHGETAIVSEIVREICGLDEDQKKTSAARSGSSVQETSPSNGTAASVALPARIESVDAQ